MQPIFLDDPAWRTTFPHLVAPLPDEWLMGLLLRCDEANHWESGTVFWLVTGARTVTDKQRWKRNMKDPQLRKQNIPSFFVPSPVNINSLAHYLGIERRLCVLTTYYEELVRCYDLVNPHPRLLYPYFAFRLCPACLTEARLLRRLFLLPYLKYCPQHQVALLNTCSCGIPLFPFNQHALPFTCPSCRLDWAHLPLIPAQASHMETEKKLLSHFTWLLAQGTPALLMNALERINERLAGKNEIHLINGATWTRSLNNVWILRKDTNNSLGALAVALVSLNISPQEIFVQDEPERQIPLRKHAFDMRSVLTFLMYATRLDETCDGYS